MYELIAPAERRVWHERSATTLVARAERGRDVAPAEIAHHLLRAGPNAALQAANYAQQAGDRSGQLLAFEDAVSWYEQTLQALAATDHISVGFIDTFSLVDAAVSNPAAFGLTNVTDACYTGPFTGGPPAPCSNPASYLFWDIQHPTETGHELIATLAENVAVPEPPTLPIFLAAAFLILICWRCTGRTHQNQTTV